MEKNGKKPKTYDDLINMVIQVFLNAWKNAYKRLKGRKKKILLPYMPQIFRRWYATAFIDESYLTPSIVITALNEEYKMPLNSKPRLCLKNDPDGNLIPKFTMINYQVDDHALIKDLKIFLETLKPTFDLEAIKSHEKPNCFSDMSMMDAAYFDYLYEISLRLNLVRKMPSVNASISIVDDSYIKFFNSSNKAVLKKIIDTTLNICVEQLSEPFQIQNNYKQKLISFLKSPKTIDEIFSDIFFEAGIDIIKFLEDIDDNFGAFNKMFGINDDDPDVSDINIASLEGIGAIQADLMNSTFYFGVILDKYFLTPFSHYLGIIQTLYVMPFDIFEELDNVYHCLLHSQDVDNMLYSPCALYSLTDCGRELLGVRTKKTYDEFSPPRGVSMEIIITSISNVIALSKFMTSKNNEEKTGIYTIKIVSEGNKKYWQTLEISENTTLEGLHLLLCGSLYMNTAYDYSFFIGETENPFAEYTPKTNRKKQRKVENTKISELQLKANDVILHRLYNAPELYDLSHVKKKVAFKISILKYEVTSINPANYPKIVRRGKAVNTLEY